MDYCTNSTFCRREASRRIILHFDIPLKFFAECGILLIVFPEEDRATIKYGLSYRQQAYCVCMGKDE